MKKKILSLTICNGIGTWTDHDSPDADYGQGLNDR